MPPVQLFAEKCEPKVKKPAPQAATAAGEAPKRARKPAPPKKLQERQLMCTVERAGDAMQVTDPHGLVWRFEPKDFELAQPLFRMSTDSRMIMVFPRPDGSTIERDPGYAHYASSGDALGLLYCLVPEVSEQSH